MSNPDGLPSVTNPKVPSEPTNRLFRLYPADDFLGLLLVLITVPSDRTTVRLMTQSFIVPYLTALVPEQLVPTMPPIFALGPSQLQSVCVTWAVLGRTEVV